MSEIITNKDMELINQYTGRELSKDEVYVFSFILCDNDVDKNFECFTTESLLELKNLFIGKIGSLDNPFSSDNLVSRIFDCKLEKVKGRRTAYNEQYVQLKARAYIIKDIYDECFVNHLIRAPIKEVHLSCSIRKRICSYCECETTFCTHQPGDTYNGKLCYLKLIGVADVYDFSITRNIASPCKDCVSEAVCKYNDSVNEWCRVEGACPHFVPWIKDSVDIHKTSYSL